VVAVGAAAGVAGWQRYNGGARARDASQPGQPGAVATVAPTTIAAAPTPTSRPTAQPTVTPASRDVTFEVSEGDLELQLSRMLVGQPLGTTPLGEATVQTVTVALRDRQVKVGGNAKAGFLIAPFTAAGTVAPNGEGRPIVRVNEATVGGVVLPDPARAALADSLQTQVDGLFAERSMKVRTIEIADGKMRVVGTSGS
jgi:hypothetical protein